MKVGILKERTQYERRVAAVPETISKMVKAGTEVLVETGAGDGSFIDDKAFEAAGARICPDAASLLAEAEVVIKVNRPGNEEIAGMKDGAVFVGFIGAAANPETVKALAGKGVTSFAMEMVPRITRAQRMDALSTMSTAAGYKAVLLAANACGRFFPMLTTAVGSVPPAKAILIGVGVAGLQAIATARRLGAVVTAFDTRPAAGEQAKSLGAEFVAMDVDHSQAEDAGGYAKEQTEDFYKQEQDLIRKHSKDADIVITTALIPGKRAPMLITEEMVKEMKPGSVIVDLAVEMGGNCVLSELGKEVVKYGVTVIGPANLPSGLPVHSSLLYAKNMLAFLNLISPDGKGLNIDLADDIIKGSMVTHSGEVTHPAFKKQG
ncbi:MAG: Re/Si-specific NAD(P)(+) transhydrogenase subunit alpha [Deltaproteobacteria bacterium]|nr:Re/Si-specific NAD(P)(+) transhydrogenase subunit alpha [Deltaproteobacteria bacterium]